LALLVGSHKAITGVCKARLTSHTITGSGKTTLLSVVTDSLQPNLDAAGSIQLPKSSILVPQDDQLHGFFTCRSYLQHYARLAGIGHKPGTKERIDGLLKQLGIWEQADTIVGDLFLKGLSGGQKRRLSIALEALTEPALLCLDEPTSGLDAESALQVMEFLKKYASTGRRVILTIHQPSSFIWQIIDNTILLSKGKLMYGGPRKDMESFFSQCGYPTPVGWNPADHYVTVVNDEFRDHALSVDEWARAFAGWNGVHHQVASDRNFISVGVRPARQGTVLVAFELVYRYFLNLFFNLGLDTGCCVYDNFSHTPICLHRHSRYPHCHVRHVGVDGGCHVLGSWRAQ
jgi:ABC-type multidrug transport system ATPase subunit